jgi:hypothetical protein
MDKRIEYSSTGYVLGNLWGGGQGMYPAEFLSGAESKEQLIKIATEMLDGRLDSGMGFESLVGARLDVRKTTTVEIDGDTFQNVQTERVYIGKLTKAQKDALS